MEFVSGLAMQSFEQVLLTLLHNWPYLLLSVLIAAALKLYIKADKVSAFLNRHRGAGVAAATAAAVGTPLCSCGTTAVVLGMMAGSMPWAPIVAFMVASPLTSPEGLVYTAGLFGWPFSIAFFLASIVLGLAGGGLAAALERRGWLAGQNRYADRPASAAPAGTVNPSSSQRVFSLEIPTVELKEPAASCSCSGSAPAVQEQPAAGCGCGSGAQSEPAAYQKPPAVTPWQFIQELFDGGKRLLVMFVGFAFIGYFLNGLIPAAWMSTLFGAGNVYNVPLAATLALPFYLNAEASLPLIRAMLDNGMSQGAALAFLIAGSGTSIGAITGALTIARWRVVGLVVGVLWAGAVVSGLVFNFLQAMGLF